MESLEEIAEAEINQAIIKSTTRRLYAYKGMVYLSGSFTLFSAGVGSYELATGNYRLAAGHILLTTLNGILCYVTSKKAKCQKETIEILKQTLEQSLDILKGTNEKLDNSQGGKVKWQKIK